MEPQGRKAGEREVKKSMGKTAELHDYPSDDQEHSFIVQLHSDQRAKQPWTTRTNRD